MSPGGHDPEAGIVLVGPAPPLRGGIARYNGLLHRALLRGGFDVEVIGFRRQYPRILFPGRTQLDESRELEPVPSRSLIDTVNPLSWLAAARDIGRRPGRRVVFQWWNPAVGVSLGTVARLLRTFSGQRIVFICHNLEAHEPGWADRPLTRYALAAAHRTVVHAEAQRAAAARWLPGLEVVCHPHPNYPPLPGPRPSRGAARRRLGLDGPTLLFFGLVRRYKGLEDLIRALGAVRAEVPVTLVIAGEFYEPRRLYDALIRSLGLEASVRIVDRYVPNEDVGLYFTAADAVVCPYRSASQSGVVQLAFGYGIPVICTRAGGLAEAVRDGETGFLAEPGDPGDLARAILAFYRALGTRDFAGAIERDRSRFEWAGIVEAITG